MLLLLILLIAILPPRTIAFHYVHYWRVNFSGSIMVSGNQSLPTTPYWDYIANTSWQTCEQLSFMMALDNYTIGYTDIATDADGNPHLVLNITSSIEPEGTLRWREEWLFAISDRRPSLPQINLEQSGGINEVPELMDPAEYIWYTRETSLWKTQNDTIRGIANHIQGELPEERQNNVLALVYAAIQWIQDTIMRATGLTEPQYPEETIESQIGDCDDQSNLLITLLRIYNIPSYLMTGHWFQDGTRTRGFIWGSLIDDAYLFVDWKNSIGHGWVMAYIPPWGWLPFDLTAAAPGINPAYTYTDSLYASGLPFVTLWQITASDYIAERRAERSTVFAYNLHRTDYEDWTSLGSIPIADLPYFVTNLVTLVALIGTLSVFGCLVGLAVRSQPKEEPNQ